ncbi:MAG: HAMP domain-containing histidine kinase [Spirochaetales bacterium]|nr:HAMP domain-containing histidine kinase [Spirochaetales bacterium]
MKNRYSSSRQHYVWISVFALILLGTVVLGSLQITWITRAAQTEKFRFLSGIFSGTSRSVYLSLEDIRTLVPVVQQQVSQDREPADTDTLKELLKLWNSRARYPELVTHIYRASPGALIGISRQGLKEVQPDPETAALVNTLFSPGLSVTAVGDISDKLLLRGYLCVIPDEFQKPVWYRHEDLQTVPPLTQCALFKLDQDYYLNKVIPAALGEHISDASYQVSSSVLTNTENMPEDRILFHIPAPSAELAKLSERYLESRILAIPPPRKTNSKEGPDLSPHNTDEKTPIRQTSLVPLIGHISFTIEEGSVDAKFNRWILSNAGASFGLLLVLVSSFAVMFFLYRKTGRLRTMEQEFVASMSHELRLPVTVIKAVSDNLSSGIVANIGRVTEYGREIHREALRLEHMVESILMYSGLQSGQTALNHSQPVEIQAVCEAAIKEIKALGQSDDMAISFTGDTDAGTVICEQKGFTTVMQNLLLNAVIHGRPAEPGVQCRITLTVCRVHSNRVRICVEDNGRGLRPSEQKQVWKPFYRTEASLTNQEPGSGLGLHLVRQIIHVNGGTVTVESPYRTSTGSLCQGCRFCVELPSEGSGT